jgi:hypothetical protein
MSYPESYSSTPYNNPIILKSEYRGDLRRINLDQTIFDSLFSLEIFLKKVYNIPDDSPAVIKYLDDEKDWITLQSDLDLRHAATLVKRNFRVKVFNYRQGTKFIKELIELKESIEKILQKNEANCTESINTFDSDHSQAELPSHKTDLELSSSSPKTTTNTYSANQLGYDNSLLHQQQIMQQAYYYYQQPQMSPYPMTHPIPTAPYPSQPQMINRPPVPPSQTDKNIPKI